MNRLLLHSITPKMNGGWYGLLRGQGGAIQQKAWRSILDAYSGQVDH